MVKLSTPFTHLAASFFILQKSPQPHSLPGAQSGDIERPSLNCQPVLFSYELCFCHLRSFLLPLSAVYCSAKVVAIIPAASCERRDHNRAALTMEGHFPLERRWRLYTSGTNIHEHNCLTRTKRRTLRLATYCCHLVLSLVLGIGVCCKCHFHSLLSH